MSCGMRKFLKNSHILKAKLSEKVEITVDGHVLSKADNERVINANVYLAGVLRDLRLTKLFEKNIHLSRQLSDIPMLISIWDALRLLDYAYMQSQLKNMLLSIRDIPGKGMTMKSAKKHCARHGVASVQVPGNSFLLLVREMVLYLLVETDEQLRIELFKAVNTVVQFTTRLTLNDVDWIVTDEVQKYLDLEATMKTWSYNPDIVRELHGIINEWCGDIDLITETPTDSHGYGATKDVRRSAGTACKWRSMEQNSSKEHFFAAQLLGITDHELVERTTLRRLNDYIQGRQLPDGLKPEERYSIYQLVPKGYDKKRGVSMEDTPNQYYQKIVFDRIDKHLQAHPEIGIYLHDQERNRMLSRFGSVTGTYGTIDLSSASDTVTWTLVRQMFQDTPLYPVMKLLRTTKCVIKETGVSVVLEKAFPMGSAICFPIESLVFAAVCELANRHMGVHKDYLVYGDDMVVPLETADEVVSLLNNLHFSVNSDKSYLPGHAFTESCGGEYYHFYDVSPLRLSRKIDFIVEYKREGSRVSSNKESLAENLRDLHNKAFERGYKTLCKMLVQQGAELNPYLFFDYIGEGWLSVNPTNMHLAHKYVADEDVGSVKGWMIRTRVRRSRIRFDKHAEALRLERWFEDRQVVTRRYARTAQYAESAYVTGLMADEGRQSNVGSAYSNWCWKWLPDPGLYRGQIPYA